MSLRIFGRLYKYIARPFNHFMYIWIDVNFVMHNIFLLVPHRESSVSSTPFQTVFKYLLSVATWSQEFLLLILHRLVVSCLSKLNFLFLQIYRSFLFYTIAWEMWLYSFPYTVTWVPVACRIFTIDVPCLIWKLFFFFISWGYDHLLIFSFGCLSFATPCFDCIHSSNCVEITVICQFVLMTSMDDLLFERRNFLSFFYPKSCLAFQCLFSFMRLNFWCFKGGSN